METHLENRGQPSEDAARAVRQIQESADLLGAIVSAAPRAERQLPPVGKPFNWGQILVLSILGVLGGIAASAMIGSLIAKNR